MGWIRLPEGIRNGPFWPKTRRYTKLEALIDLKLEASWRESKCEVGSRILNLPAGSVLTSQVRLATRWKWNRETVKKLLSMLNTLEILRIETAKGIEHGYTVITFLNNIDFEADENVKFPIAPEKKSSVEPASNQHIRRSTDVSESVRKNSMYAGSRDEKEEVEDFDEAARVGDYWSLANDIKEANRLMRLPRGTLESVARVKALFGKSAKVIDFKTKASGMNGRGQS